MITTIENVMETMLNEIGGVYTSILGVIIVLSAIVFMLDKKAGISLFAGFHKMLFSITIKIISFFMKGILLPLFTYVSKQLYKFLHAIVLWIHKQTKKFVFPMLKKVILFILKQFKKASLFIGKQIGRFSMFVFQKATKKN